MVQKKITTYMSKSSKKGRSTGSRFRRRTLKKYSGARVFKMRRTLRAGAISLTSGYEDISGNASYPWFKGFKLDSLPAYTEITNLFQQYKIKGLKFRLSPRFDNMDLSTNLSGLSLPRFYIAKDRDGTVDSATENDMMQQRVMLRKGNRDIQFYCAYPKFKTTVSGGYIPQNKWLTSVDPDVEHCSYAIGAYTPLNSAPDNINYDVWITAYIHCKGLK